MIEQRLSEQLREAWHKAVDAGNSYAMLEDAVDSAIVNLQEMEVQREKVEAPVKAAQLLDATVFTDDYRVITGYGDRPMEMRPAAVLLLRRFRAAIDDSLQGVER